VQVFRIVTRRHLAGAFSGEGARLHGGRWNPKGVATVYTAANRSLALLEMLVQDEPLRARYWIVPAEVPDALEIEHVDPAKLPTDWRERLDITRRIGSTWAERASTAVLAVPSTVLRAETNFVLNPRHPSFPRIRIGRPSELETDLRLLRKPGAEP